MRKFLIAFLVVALVLCCVLALVACDPSNSGGTGGGGGSSGGGSSGNNKEEQGGGGGGGSSVVGGDDQDVFLFWLNDDRASYYVEAAWWNQPKGDVVIPSTYEGKPVTVVDDFQDCDEITSITLPNTITTIRNSAFLRCTALKSITIPNSVKTIGNGAFEECSSLQSIVIPDSVTDIGYSILKDCTSVKSVTLPYIWERAFDDLFYSQVPSTLKTITITGGTSISEMAFFRCNNVTAINLPNTIKTIEDSAFYNCNSLKEIEIPYGVESIGEGAFANCSSLTEVTVPDSVTSIGYEAFDACEKLESMTLPFVGGSMDATEQKGRLSYLFDDLDGTRGKLKTIVITGEITSLSNSAFAGCSSLTSLTLPDTITSIGDSAFRGCSSLEELTIADGVETIGSYAFYGCSSLLSLDLPKGVTSIGAAAFFNCSSLASLTLPFVGASANASGDYGKFEYMFRESFNYFTPNALKTVVITGGKSIADSAFSGCSYLETIAFQSEEYNITIGQNAFKNCTSLVNLTLPDNIISIGDDALYGCNKLQYNVRNDNAEDKYLGNDENPYLVLVSVGNKNVTSFTMSDKTKIIYAKAFNLCMYLTEISVPSNVVQVGYMAFAGCTSLQSIAIPFVGAKRGASGDEAKFGYIFGTVPSSVKYVSFTSLISSIGEYAFTDCSSIETVRLPGSLNSIGIHSFYGCTSLTKIIFAGTATQWRSVTKGFAWYVDLPDDFVVELTDGTILERSEAIK